MHRRPFVAEFSVEGACSGTVTNNPGGMGTPAFAAQYSKVRLGGGWGPCRAGVAFFAAPASRLLLDSWNALHTHSDSLRALPQFYNDGKLLAVADEEGFVSIVDTSCELPTEMADDWGPNKPRAQWMAHRNAVFDLSWCNVRGWRVWQSWVHKQGRHAWEG